MPEVLPQIQVRELRLRGAIELGSYLVRVKVMPSGPEVPSDKLLESVKGVLGKEMTVKGSKEDPIAFGLYALIIDIVAPEEEGMVDKVEAAVAKAPLVTQSDLLGVSRMSSHLKV
jgi:elongation factor 1-beta